MATAVKRKLSGSTDGKMIKIVSASSAGTTVHTAVSGTTAGTFDEVWLWAVNSNTAGGKLTVEYGGTTSPDDTIEVTIPPESGMVLVVPGLILQNSNVVRAFAASANVMMVAGFVNSITD